MDEKTRSLKNVYPLIPLRDGIVFPGTENVLIFGRQKSITAVKSAFEGQEKKVILLLQKNVNSEDPQLSELYSIGVLATVKKLFESEKGEVTGLLAGEMRVKCTRLLTSDPYPLVEVEMLKEDNTETQETKALVRHIHTELKRAINLGKGIDIVFLMNIMSGATSAQFADQVAMILDLRGFERQELLEELNLNKRLQKETELVSKEVQVLEIEKNIQTKTQKKFEQGMKETVLREKLKTIEQELGGGVSEEDAEITELKSKIKKAKMPLEAEKKALKELKRLAQMSQYNPEVSYVRTYIEWLIDLPWGKEDVSNVDIKRAEKILHKDHFGLYKVKERILEYLAVNKLKKDIEKKNKKFKDIKQPTILCFAGPPGVGKTSIGKSIARALNRKFVKISLGGIRDEAEIRGHRRTYVGALPGRIIQTIKEAGSKNPVFMLDEIDKLGHDYRGDPSSALLEALDPEQNHSFSDHYLELPFDLSEVMFITTANMLDTIPSALKDRLEVIQFAGYTEDEKFNIAKNYLITKQKSAHGIFNNKITITDRCLKILIHRYTREAGVRELERQIATIFRKIARQLLEKKYSKKLITEKNITQYLGQFKYSSQVIENKDSIGISTGLAWTQAGGDILFIEVAIMPGKGTLTLTGHLGDVMKESCQAALSYIRSRWKLYNLKEDFYKSIDIHVHVPEGAVPKDGPSAGIAITSAMISALTKIPVNRFIGMTGEITLRGRVMEIGGVKEKVIAAHRAGLTTIILPNENKKDLEDIPKYILSDLQFKFVKNIDTVIHHVLLLKKAK